MTGFLTTSLNHPGLELGPQSISKWWTCVDFPEYKSNRFTFNIISTSLVHYAVGKAEDASDDGLLEHVLKPSGIEVGPMINFKMADQRGLPRVKIQNIYL